MIYSGQLEWFSVVETLIYLLNRYICWGLRCFKFTKLFNMHNFSAPPWFTSWRQDFPLMLGSVSGKPVYFLQLHWILLVQIRVSALWGVELWVFSFQLIMLLPFLTPTFSSPWPSNWLRSASTEDVAIPQMRIREDKIRGEKNLDWGVRGVTYTENFITL